MTKFADDLYADLMEQHGAALTELDLARAAADGRRPVPAVRGHRPLWLTAGGLATAAAVAGGFAVFGESAAAYAVTQNPNGTVTISVDRPSGISGANAQLKLDGDPVVVVPVRPGCPSAASLPHPSGHPAESSSAGDRNGTVTIQAKGLPGGVTVIVAAEQGPNGAMQMSIGLTTAPPPACVSLPPIPTGPGPQSSQGAD